MSIVKSLALLLILCTTALINSFNVPTFYANKYKKGQQIPLYYNKIFSEKTQLPFAYSQLSFVCKPEKTNDAEALNFGELFQGDRIVESDIEVKALENVDCSTLCTIELTDEDLNRAQGLIDEDYRIEWIMDGLPGATRMLNSRENRHEYEPGFMLGYKEKDLAYLNNFFEIKIPFQYSDKDEILIVGFEVVPRSVKMPKGKCVTPSDQTEKFLLREGHAITYGYSVQWIQDPVVNWTSRWDMYIDSSNPKVHWYSIINSLMLLTVLSFIVAFILLAALRKDIATYNEEDALEGQDDTIGWKLVHGDVFRAPKNLNFLCVMLGTGIQLISTLGFTLAFAVLGFLNPSYRGGLAQYGVFFFAICGMFGGYHNARLNKAFWPTKTWMGNALWTASAFPLFLFVIISILNTFYWTQNSSNALPAGTFVALISIWLFINLPLTIIGAYFGNKKQAYENPVRTNHIPRQIPEQVWYLKAIPSILIGGLIPFTVIFMELFFILKSMWQDQYYYMYGFLAVVVVLLVVTIIEVTIAMIYFQLCGEDYRWQWRSFILASSSVWYIFGLGTVYFLTRLDVEHGFSSALYYFAYLVTGLVVYMITTGTIGFFAVYWFLRRIYSALKVD